MGARHNLREGINRHIEKESCEKFLRVIVNYHSLYNMLLQLEKKVFPKLGIFGDFQEEKSFLRKIGVGDHHFYFLILNKGMDRRLHAKNWKFC